MTITPLALVNPGAESGDATGWTLASGSSNFGSVTSQGSITPHSGSRFFRAGQTGTRDIYQQVDVSAFASAIDGGGCAARARSWYRGNSDISGRTGELYIAAVGSDGSTVLDTVSLGGAQQHVGAWYPFEEIFKDLPSGTRFLRIGTISVSGGGSGSFQCWDDFELEFSDDGEADFPTLIYLCQAIMLTVWNFPAAGILVNQASLLGAITSTMDLLVSQATVLVAWRGRTANPQLRAWTFSLDGHDFYVLRLGGSSTLVYDVYSEQWMDWESRDFGFWRPNCGINWFGAQKFAASFGSNIVAGDDNFGLLWFLDPTRPFDDSPILSGNPTYFRRITMGQVPIRGREVLPCYVVWLTTDMGQPAYEGAGVRLEISDDAGATFDDMGFITITAGENAPELSWYSLGQISAPGRLFRITDDGAIARIDGLEMNDPDDDA